MKKSHLFAFLILSFFLSGCLKVNLLLDVNPDGSSTFSFTMGYQEEFAGLVEEEGDPVAESLPEVLQEENITVRTWVADGYVWQESTVEFSDLDELNQFVAESTLFNSFSLTQHRGLWRDRFVLQAELAPFNDDEELFTEDMLIDPEAFIDMAVFLRLPGEISETNGTFDANREALYWNWLPTNASVPIQAKSEAWIWWRVGLSGVLGLLLIGGTGGVMLVSKNGIGGLKRHLPFQSFGRNGSNKQISVNDTDQIDTVDQIGGLPYFTDLPIENLLVQVNTKLLNEQGKLVVRENEIKLEWISPSDRSRKIIKVQAGSDNNVTINGRQFPATATGVKEGITACVRFLRSRGAI